MKAVETVYTTIITTLENVYEHSQEPEALGDLQKLLVRRQQLCYFLDYILPQVTKPSKLFQSEYLDFSVTANYVAALTVAYPLLQLLEVRTLRVTGIEIAHIYIIFM